MSGTLHTAAACAWLASDDAYYVTGEALNRDWLNPWDFLKNLLLVQEWGPAPQRGHRATQGRRAAGLADQTGACLRVGGGLGRQQLVQLGLEEQAALAVEGDDLALEAVGLHLGLEVLDDVLAHLADALRMINAQPMHRAPAAIMAEAPAVIDDKAETGSPGQGGTTPAGGNVISIDFGQSSIGNSFASHNGLATGALDGLERAASGGELVISDVDPGVIVAWTDTPTALTGVAPAAEAF